LSSLFAATGGAAGSWSNTKNWANTSVSICTWYTSPSKAYRIGMFLSRSVAKTRSLMTNPLIDSPSCRAGMASRAIARPNQTRAVSGLSLSPTMASSMRCQPRSAVSRVCSFSTCHTMH
jgi:hypothetical protein